MASRKIYCKGENLDSQKICHLDMNSDVKLRFGATDEYNMPIFLSFLLDNLESLK